MLLWLVLSILMAGHCVGQNQHVVVGDCSLDLPASWRAEPVTGIDSTVVRYRGDNFLCEIEVGALLGDFEQASARLRRAEANPKTLKSGHTVIRIGRLLGEIASDNGDHNVRYAGLPYDTLLHVPRPGAYATIRVFYRNAADQPKALCILHTVKIAEKSSTPLPSLAHLFTTDMDRWSAAIARLRVGMSEEEIDSILRPVSRDRGVFYLGNSGTRRLYFQLDELQEIWVEMSGMPDSRAIAIGEPEPKRPWKRSSGDSIVVD